MAHWLETIELQGIIKRKKELEQTLKHLENEMITSTWQQKINIYYKYSIESDYMIQIHHAQLPGENGSPLGIRIASVLKEFGLVNHTMWAGRASEQINPTN